MTRNVLWSRLARRTICNPTGTLLMSRPCGVANRVASRLLFQETDQQRHHCRRAVSSSPAIEERKRNGDEMEPAASRTSGPRKTPPGGTLHCHGNSSPSRFLLPSLSFVSLAVSIARFSMTKRGRAHHHHHRPSIHPTGRETAARSRHDATRRLALPMPAT